MAPIQKLVSALAIISLALATPSRRYILQRDVKVGPVIPGPGLPSLESLGLTSEDLRDPDFKSKHPVALRGGRAPTPHSPDAVAPPPKAGAPAAPPSCSVNTGTEGTRVNAISCENYLYSIGSQYCDVPSNQEYAVMCSAGDTDVVGWNYWNVGGGDLIADCSDVAGGLSYIIDNCSSCYSDYCKVEGTQYASNRADYVVYVGRYL